MYLWALISWWMILFLKIVNDNKSFFVCISEKLNTSKLMKIATLPIVPTWDSSRTRLRLWMMQQLEWSLLSFYSFFLPSSIFGLLCQVIKHSNIHSLWPITRKNCLCIFYGSYTICSKPLINAIMVMVQTKYQSNEAHKRIMPIFGVFCLTV